MPGGKLSCPVMVNNDIITSLKNAVSRGEDLALAKQILINSGYNSQEVEEASKFIGKGIITDYQAKPHEELTMPEEKKPVSKLSKLKFWKKKKQEKPIISAPAVKPLQKQKISPEQLKQEIRIPSQVPRTTQQLNQQPIPQKIEAPNLGTQPPLEKQLKQISPKSPSHLKEIILVFILLVLIGVLIITITLKDTILRWFS